MSSRAIFSGKVGLGLVLVMCCLSAVKSDPLQLRNVADGVSGAKNATQAYPNTSITTEQPATGVASFTTPEPLVASAINLQKSAESAAPKASEFVDVARLVLEHNRDVAAETAKHIERAINIVIGLMTLLAAFGAWLGWNKVASIEVKAKERLEQFNTELDSLRTSATEVQGEFAKSLDGAMTELRAEIHCRTELLTARAEIAIAESAEDDAQKMQGFASAIGRIERAILLPHLPCAVKIMALADLGFSKKRHGDVYGAFQKVVEAEALARSRAETAHMIPLLAYNAACYASILNRADTQHWLEKAIEGGEDYRDSAATDSDFKNAHEQPWFKSLMKKS